MGRLLTCWRTSPLQCGMRNNCNPTGMRIIPQRAGGLEAVHRGIEIHQDGMGAHPRAMSTASTPPKTARASIFSTDR
ncbi:MAG: hypothetical protein QOG58_5942 [Caballeronia sp.]|nr:hypothetical protein [Caballeronia sp.]